MWRVARGFGNALWDALDEAVATALAFGVVLAFRWGWRSAPIATTLLGAALASLAGYGTWRLVRGRSPNATARIGVVVLVVAAMVVVQVATYAAFG